MSKHDLDTTQCENGIVKRETSPSIFGIQLHSRSTFNQENTVHTMYYDCSNKLRHRSAVPEGRGQTQIHHRFSYQFAYLH